MPARPPVRRSRRGRLASTALVAGLLLACGEDAANRILPSGTWDAQPDAAPSAPPADSGAGGSPPRPDAAPDGPSPDVPPAPTSDAAPVPTDSAADAGPDLAVDAGDLGVVEPACRNGLDDDGDGLVDYPVDPGCGDDADPDEVDPAAPACSDTADNDADDLVDLDDPGCAGPADPNENDACGDVARFRDVTGQSRVEGTTADAPAVFDAGCRTNLAPEAVFLVTVPPGILALTAQTAGSDFDTVLSVRRVCAEPASEVACNDDLAPAERTSALRVDRPLGDYYILVDGFREESGAFVLALHGEVPDGTPCPAPDAFEACALGSTCTGGTCQRAACFNSEDDDGDGRVDYPEEPGCETPSDPDETDPDPLPECGNGQDDDFNGAVDYPDDPSCQSAADPSEQPPPECDDNADNDGDSLVDLDDPGCNNDPTWPWEWNYPACRDGEDNDADGRTDYPADPGCDSLEDPLEDDPEVLPACADGEDNDQSGFADYPEDRPGCTSASDPVEAPPCDTVVPEEITGLEDIRGNIEDASNDFVGSCNALTGPEVVLLWRVDAEHPLQSVRISARGSRFDTLLYTRTQCEAEAAPDLACADWGAPDGAAELVLGPQAPGTDLWLFVDSNSGTPPGVFRLQITAALDLGGDCSAGGPFVCGEGLSCRDGLCALADCHNGLDDDHDGLADWPLDPGCALAGDDDEEDPAVPPACANGVDDDRNGLIDYPEDSGCAGAGDTFEGPECDDAVDNDGDGTLDYDMDGDGGRDRNADPQCACVADPHEGPDTQCANGCDDDGDGLVDLLDPGCAGGPGGDNEYNVPLCRDGLDNDSDGWIDFPDDPGCPNGNSPLEDDPAVPPACADGRDNDGDGLIDYVRFSAPFGLTPDDGCISAADADERGPCDSPRPELPGTGSVAGSTLNLADEHVPTGCGYSDGAAEAVYVAHLTDPVHIIADTEGSEFDTILYVRSECGPERFCPVELPDAGLPPADAALPVDAMTPVDVALPVDAVTPVDVALDGAPLTDAAVDASPPDAAAPPADLAVPPPDAPVVPPGFAFFADGICLPGPTEVACNDDAIGVQSRVELDWPGGDLYFFVDGFGSGRGSFSLHVQATWPEGGTCDPDAVPFATCAAGTFCRNQADATRRCVP